MRGRDVKNQIVEVGDGQSARVGNDASRAGKAFVDAGSVKYKNVVPAGEFRLEGVHVTDVGQTALAPQFLGQMEASIADRRVGRELRGTL